jgi:hypothetical protein
MTGPWAVYARGVSYSDEYYFVDPDPMLDAAIRAWRVTGDPSEIQSLLQHQEENSEYPDVLISGHATEEEAEIAAGVLMHELVRTLTFVDFGFGNFGMTEGGSTRWYSTEDDDLEWAALFDSAQKSAGVDDTARLEAWCQKHEWPFPQVTDRSLRMSIAERAMEDVWKDFVDDDTDSFLADAVAEQLLTAGRLDLLIDLWSSLAAPLVYVGPPPAEKAIRFDLRRMSIFREREIDTAGFTATSLAPPSNSRSAALGFEATAGERTTAEPTTAEPADVGASGGTDVGASGGESSPRKGLFGRIFGR